ncbi:TPA: YbjN domain-containing protein [Providencia stuartii]|uniref:YbjN domain-containing protein n=1 Tax=Providencia TaxID=586 RepID=UPI002349DD2E|nr:YbjN domain-containing protein [Providencia sp. PROV266]HEF8774611.1 YbjN domain-containing protein [Providencia stuartii]
MTNKIYTDENSTISSLLDTYRDASIGVFSISTDPDVTEMFAIKEFNVPVRVHLHANKEYITLVFIYETSTLISDEQKLRIINQINEECLLIRAYMNEDSMVLIQTDIRLVGGITESNIISTTNLFCMAVSNIFNDERTGLLFA